VAEGPEGLSNRAIPNHFCSRPQRFSRPSRCCPPQKKLARKNGTTFTAIPCIPAENDAPTVKFRGREGAQRFRTGRTKIKPKPAGVFAEKWSNPQKIWKKSEDFPRKTPGFSKRQNPVAYNKNTEKVKKTP